MSPPSLVFGAGGIGNTPESFTYTWTTAESVSSLLGTLSDVNVRELDGAASYPPGNPRDSERLLGEAKAADKGFIIDSKVQGVLDGPMLDEARIGPSIDKTLSLLGVKKIRTLYAHFPDKHTPLEETARAFDKEYRAGKFERLGICNYSPAQVEEYFSICEAKGYVKPAVYQGNYNALCRHYEEKLFPLLRKHNCAFFAYSPLAGGFLTGKVTFRPDAPPKDSSNGDAGAQSSLYRTRWEGKSEFAMYTRIFNRPEVHDALRRFKAAVDEHNATADAGRKEASLTEVSLRLLMHHSALKGELGDAIIFGAKSEEQVRGNVELCRKEPLPEALVRAGERMWEDVKDVMEGTF